MDKSHRRARQSGSCPIPPRDASSAFGSALSKRKAKAYQSRSNGGGNENSSSVAATGRIPPMPLRVVEGAGTGQCSGRVAALAGGKRIWPSGPLSAVPRRSCKLVTFTGCGPLELTPNGIISYLTRPGISNPTKATYHASVRTYCRYLVLRGQRQDDPCMGTHG